MIDTVVPEKIVKYEYLCTRKTTGVKLQRVEAEADAELLAGLCPEHAEGLGGGQHGLRGQAPAVQPRPAVDGLQQRGQGGGLEVGQQQDALLLRRGLRTAAEDVRQEAAGGREDELVRADCLVSAPDGRVGESSERAVLEDAGLQRLVPFLPPEVSHGRPGAGGGRGGHFKGREARCGCDGEVQVKVGCVLVTADLSR